MEKKLNLIAGKMPEPTKMATISEELELSPEREGLAEKIALRINKFGGAAIIIDYGKNGQLGNSLEGIKKHEVVSVLSEPGQVDISAHVDFASVAKAGQSMIMHNFSL